jgi:hypothetical protein
MPSLDGLLIVGAGLFSVLLFPAAGLARLRRSPHPNHPTKGTDVQTHRHSYTNETDARIAVDKLLATGMAGTRISVLSGRMTADHREEPVGAYAGAEAGPVGGFAGMSGSTADTMGAFAGGEQRRGGFGDVDRDEIETYENGVRRVHVASHHELERRLSQAGLDADQVAADVTALHHGRVLVLVEPA